MTGPPSKKGANQVRLTLPFNDWPEADQKAWQISCRPGVRLRGGGPASRLALASRQSFVDRYGLFLGYVQRQRGFNPHGGPAAMVTPKHVEGYIAELRGRVRSVTVYNCIYHLRRAAELLAPGKTWSWLAEIEKDLALIIEPRSKFDRLRSAQQLVEAGLTLIVQAEEFATTDLRSARGIRNGLILALLALCPIRPKNFAALEIGNTFKQVGEDWWITLPARTTKSRSADERRVPPWLNPYINLYITKARRILLDAGQPTNFVWISSKTRAAMTQRKLGSLVSQITLEVFGIAISPHLFRTAAASTAAVGRGDLPGLASGLLNHKDSRIAEEHYIRSKTMVAAQAFLDSLRSFRTHD